MDRISVLFEIPKAIADGLSSGRMTRRGGVIQWASGETKGEVVTWLRESGALQEQLRQGVSVPSNVAAQLGQLQVATNVALGLQALTLATVAIGFAVVNKKLNALDAKLDAVLGELAAIREDVSWLDRRQDIALLARLHAALDSADWAERTGRMDTLPGVRVSLLEAEHHLAGVLGAMVDTGRAHRAPSLFAVYYGLLSLAGVARAQVDVLLEGEGAGAEACNALGDRLRTARDGFQKPMREFDRNARALLALPGEAKLQLREALSSMCETENRVEGYQTEYSFCASTGISLAEWRAIGADEERPLLLLLQPRTA